jgi:hypothetical protein
VVELRALPGLKCGKETFSPEAGGGVSFDGCRLNNLPHGAGRYYYENGSLQSDCVYDSGELDGLCTTYYRDPANAQQCEASYVDGDLEWEQCYFSDGAKQSVVEFTDDSGVGRVFHRSGRLDSECHYSSDGPITCERFCDNDAGTPCGKTTTDEHGEVVDEWDDCRMACQ